MMTEIRNFIKKDIFTAEEINFNKIFKAKYNMKLLIKEYDKLFYNIF